MCEGGEEADRREKCWEGGREGGKNRKTPDAFVPASFTAEIKKMTARGPQVVTGETGVMEGNSCRIAMSKKYLVMCCENCWRRFSGRNEISVYLELQIALSGKPWAAFASGLLRYTRRTSAISPAWLRRLLPFSCLIQKKKREASEGAQKPREKEKEHVRAG